MENTTGSKVVKTASFLMVTMVISRILGYLRDVFIYAQFGQNKITDAYNAAFSVPDFLYMLLVGGALSSSFIPIFSEYIHTNREKEGWKVASIVFNWVMLLLVIGVAIGFVFTPQLINLLVPGFEAEAMTMTINLTRIMFVQVLFMSLSGISMGILHSYKQFTAPAIGSVMYNVGIILGGLLLAAPIEHFFPGYGIAGFSVGVVLGSAINFFIQVPALKKVGVKYTFSFDLHNDGVKKLIMLMIPVLIGLSVSQVNLFVNQNLASGLSEGAVAALRTAQRLMQLPISIFAIAIAMAVFPSLTASFAKKNMDGFISTFSLGLRSVLFITIPAAVGIAVLRVPLIRFMFEFKTGQFTSQSTAFTAEALLYYCIGIFAYGAIHVLSRTFYSLQDTKTPVIAGVGSIIINVVFSILLVRGMQQGGLALAYSIAGIFNMLLLMILLRKKLNRGMDGTLIVKSLIQIVVAALIMGIAVGLTAWGCQVFFGVAGKIAQIIQLSAAIIIGVLVYGCITYAWKMEEARQVSSILLSRFHRRK